MAQVGDKNIRWKLGSPTYAVGDDKIRIFISGTAPRVNPNEERRYIADFENWKKANGAGCYPWKNRSLDGFGR